MQRKLGKSQQQMLDNMLSTVTVAVLLYAIFLGFIYVMFQSSATILGARTFLNITRWGSLAATMLLAAWGAYRDKRAMLGYAGITAYLFISSALLLRIETRWALIVNYGFLLAIFTFSQVYGILMSTRKIERKTTRVWFFVLAALTVLALLGIAAWRIAATSPYFNW